jgi:hypothetical protein
LWHNGLSKFSSAEHSPESSLLHISHQPAPDWEWVSSPLQGDKQFKFEEWNLISTTLRNCSWNMKSQNSYDMQGDRAFVCNSFSPLVCEDAIV